MKQLLKMIAVVAMAVALSPALAQVVGDVNDRNAAVPTRIVFEGKSSWSYWTTTRSVWYADGQQLIDQPRNQNPDGTGAAFHFQNYSRKPANASTQWVVYTLKLENVVSTQILGHAFVLGRLQGSLSTTGSPTAYNARGLAMWGGTGHRCFSGLRQERFILNYPQPVGFDQNCSHVSPNAMRNAAGQEIALQDGVPYRIVMHINDYASAAWVYDARNGAFLGSSSWYTPNYFATGGEGIGFGFICSDGAELTLACTYKNGRGQSNRPYKVEFADIVSGWF